jgi:hypothetical protein
MNEIHVKGSAILAALLLNHFGAEWDGKGHFIARL